MSWSTHAVFLIHVLRCPPVGLVVCKHSTPDTHIHTTRSSSSTARCYSKLNHPHTQPAGESPSAPFSCLTVAHPYISLGNQKHIGQSRLPDVRGYTRGWCMVEAQILIVRSKKVRSVGLSWPFHAGRPRQVSSGHILLSEMTKEINMHF